MGAEDDGDGAGRSGVRQVRELLAEAGRLHEAARALLADHARAREAVRAAVAPLRDELVAEELAAIPVSRLKDVTEGRLRLSAIEEAGLDSVRHVHEANAYELRQIPGVGAQTATQVLAAARQIARAAGETVSVRIDVDNPQPRTTALVTALHTLVGGGPELRRAVSAAQRLDAELQALLPVARPAAGRLRMLLAGRVKRARALAAVEGLRELTTLAAADDGAVHGALAEGGEVGAPPTPSRQWVGAPPTPSRQWVGAPPTPSRQWGSAGLALLLGQASVDLLRQPASEIEAWVDFELRSAEYYSLLAEIGEVPGDGGDLAAARGFLPSEVADRVQAQGLDESRLRVSLRGYQAFGARFALAQRRVILGDEMGLGKTVQAVAALAHLAAQGHTHFLVVCPASVLINWTREVRARSALKAIPLHGPEREDAYGEWWSGGGVAVTTYDVLHGLPVPDVGAGVLDRLRGATAAGAAGGAAASGSGGGGVLGGGVAQDPGGRPVLPGLLVVDEAHYVKNPDTRRSRAVAAWTGRCERVLFLTGTPMENRVEEFRSLVRYLSPELLSTFQGRDAAAGSQAFRKAVAPAYLRRNQRDVLTELPALLHVDEWEEFGAADLAAYQEAVDAGNFMAMRRAGYARPATSGKLQRLRELVEDAAKNDLKVVVFSYFREVLGTVKASLNGAGGAAGERGAVGSGGAGLPDGAGGGRRRDGDGAGHGHADGGRPGGGRVFGPIAGDVAAEGRQRLVDDFTAADGHAVLLCQIQAGGVGLNLQAASVVILCEPQVKPTLENQAVARAHRMGQVRTVQVHRLLAANTIDERLLDILKNKDRLFDAYARRSAVADATPDAVDVSDGTIARRIVEEEQRRLAASRDREAGRGGADAGSGGLGTDSDGADAGPSDDGAAMPSA